ncbi:MAG TPA: hypothetical protein DD727_00620 [Clostridiales bacterium]|nr:hypothetical protein [Clostridiales bacterium]
MSMKEKAMRDAVRYTGFQRRSCMDVQRCLERKGYAEDIIEFTLRQLREEKYLDDRAYASRKVRIMLRSRPVSIGRMKAVLRQKGIDSGLADDVLSEYEMNDFKTALEITRQKFGSGVFQGGLRDFKKIISFLKYRGFTPGVIRAVLQRTGAQGCRENGD